MQISELARLCGVTAQALRHYEKLGLIRPGRSPGGYRDYPLSMRREIVFISMSRKVGFSLPAIAEQLPAFRAGRLRIDQLVAALNAQRAEVVSHIAWLQAQQTVPPARTFQSNRKRKTP